MTQTVIDCLVDIVGCALAPDGRDRSLPLEMACEAELVAAVDANRIWPAYLKGLSHFDIDPGSDLRAVAAHASARVMHHNGKSLATARLVMPQLAENGINAVVIKGALRQASVYGTPMYRQANDLDILVSSADFRAAAELLGELGFAPQARCENRWWTSALGEQHFDSVNPGLGQIDLHHRIQQPGLPGPRSASAWLADPAHMKLGESKISIPTEEKAILLGCLNLVKAIHHREPAAMYAFEFASALLASNREGRECLVRFARDQKLMAVLLFCHTATEAAFRIALPALSLEDGDTLDTSDMPLPEMIFALPRPDTHLPRHRNLLWTLCGATNLLARLTRFSFEASRYAHAETRRLLA
ncbi:nucleotidyltransferase family protein [Aurantiacibacter poecillastricola]|uniref:nucleotidyltransferase family protein n=1 Tax=Aurantiacibacter poecillastricola TaxID=3064385 RepID=UPI00273FC80F|nr:nucleotidyltransferase family protein [Aurantiacibacter sp. 219JJ12-13]MDP5263232.1 nucleotidyltransferase family protein [Aurantiacibacter sp. 219JJ12-13]